MERLAAAGASGICGSRWSVSATRGSCCSIDATRGSRWSATEEPLAHDLKMACLY